MQISPCLRSYDNYEEKSCLREHLEYSDLERYDRMERHTRSCSLINFLLILHIDIQPPYFYRVHHNQLPL